MAQMNQEEAWGVDGRSTFRERWQSTILHGRLPVPAEPADDDRSQEVNAGLQESTYKPKKQSRPHQKFMIYTAQIIF